MLFVDPRSIVSRRSDPSLSPFLSYCRLAVPNSDAVDDYHCEQYGDGHAVVYYGVVSDKDEHADCERHAVEERLCDSDVISDAEQEPHAVLYAEPKPHAVLYAEQESLALRLAIAVSQHDAL